MESLFYSNSISLKLHPKPSSFSPRFARIEAPRLRLPPPPPAWCPRRLLSNSVLCKFEDPSLCFSSASTPQVAPFPVLSSVSSYSVQSEDGLIQKSHSIQQSVRKFLQQRKVASAGTILLVSALLVLINHSVFLQPAFAAFHNAAKSGGSAAAVARGRLICTDLLSSAWTGFLAGCLHTLSGPDHLAALAPLSIGRTPIQSAAVGALWGCGHDAGQMIFGLLFLLLKDRLHIEVIRTWGTRVVGFTLLVIGAMGIREASEVPTPCVALENVECDVGVYNDTLENVPMEKKKIGFATFATGIVHGLQPDALMMVLPALALPSRLAGAAFLAMFLVGTVVAMGSYTVLIGSFSQALKDRIPRITEKLTWASSLIAIAFGVALIVSQFFGYSLY